MRVEHFPRAEDLKGLNHPSLLNGPENLMERAIDRLARFIVQRNVNGCTSGRIHWDSLIESETLYGQQIEMTLKSLLERCGYSVEIKQIDDRSVRDIVFYINW